MTDITNPVIPGPSISDQPTFPSGVPAHFHKDYRIAEKDLIPNGDYVSVVPDWPAPEGTKVYYLNGSDFRIYTMLDGMWQVLQAQTPLDFFSQFIDIVHWNSIDGFTQ